MDEEPSDRTNELLRRYHQGSPGSKKRERVASPSSDSASAKKPLRDEGTATGKFLLRAARPASVHQDSFHAKTAALASVFRKPSLPSENPRTQDIIKRHSKLASDLIKQYDVAENKKAADEEASAEAAISSQDDVVVSIVQEPEEPRKSNSPDVKATAEQPVDQPESTQTFEQSPEPIQPTYKVKQTNYKQDNYSSSSSSINQTKPNYRSHDPRPAPFMVTQDDADAIISRRKIQASLDAGHVNAKEDETDGEEPSDSTSSPRATSPSARSKSPESEPISPPISPLDRSTSPEGRETTSFADRSMTPEEGSVSPLERSLSPEPVPQKERSVSPPIDELTQPDETHETKRSAMYNEVEDSLAALDAIADSIGQDFDDTEQEDKPEVKERSRSASSLEAADLDFSVIESSSQLNVGASKDRAILRQKGSLAKRRKPTRSSMRSKGNEEDIFTVDIPVDDSKDDLMNGHDLKAKEDIEEKEKETKKAPIRNSFMLPGLGEQPKLRPKPKVPLPNKSSPMTATEPVATDESSTTVSNTPVWMTEAKLKRQSRSPAEETSSIMRDPDSDKPAWMKEALAKKRRSLDLLQKKEDMKLKEKTQDNSSAAPWVKERPLKHVDRAPPLEEPVDVANNNASRGGPSIRDVGGATIFSTVPSSRIDNLTKLDRPHLDDTQKVDSLSISKSEKELLNEKDFKNGNNKWLSDSPRSRDLLTPIKHGSVDVNSNALETHDENTPPSKTSSETEKQPSTVISSLEQSSNTDILRNKPQLPPLNKTSVASSNNNKEQSESDDVPSWKAEIQLRRRSKVFIPSQKPEQPIKLVETPKWKLDLAERTKNKKDPDVPKPMTEILTQTTTPQPHATPPSVPPWQQELAERKKRNSLNPRVLEPLDKPSAKEEPEWAGLAEKRRSRLANKNPLPDIGDSAPRDPV